MEVGPHQFGDGLEERRRRLSRTDGDGGAVVGDVVAGEADDAADRLGIEENECCSDAAPQRQRVVVQDPPEHGEVTVLVQ
ncbi:hypothetical protein [Streptomyces sp. NPDC003710]